MSEWIERDERDSTWERKSNAFLFDSKGCAVKLAVDAEDDDKEEDDGRGSRTAIRRRLCSIDRSTHRGK